MSIMKANFKQYCRELKKLKAHIISTIMYQLKLLKLQYRKWMI